MSYSFRDKPRSRLSDRLRGKSGDELLQELRQEFDKDRTSSFLDSNPNWGFSPAGSAFPRRHMFDDDEVDDVLRSHGRGRTDLRAHLDDLARRHPEFADHLRSPPGWVSDFHTSSSGGGGGSSSGNFGGSYGGSARAFFNEEDKKNTGGDHQNQQPHPEPHPAGQEQHQPTEHLQETKASDSYGSALPKGVRDNLSQHGLRNTDPEIGLKGQAAVKEDRNQRSMSAPPDGRSQLNSDKPQRFVSKIEINPVNPAAVGTAGTSNTESNSGKPPMAPPKQPQQQGNPPQHKTSTVRHIPIFVEGRDEPVLPKNIDQDFTVPPSRPAQQFSSQPHAQQQFHQQHHPQQQSQPPPQRKPSHPHQANREQHPQPQQQESKENIHQEPLQPNQPQPQCQHQAEKKPKFNNDPLYQIQLVRDEVNELRTRIEEYKGTSRTDKEYIYLDEMLTRNLIKLDIIETDGKENVRTARKETIKCIQQCINLLESKVPQTPVAQSPSITSFDENSGCKMDVDENSSKNSPNSGNSDCGNDKQSNKQCGDNDKQNMDANQQQLEQKGKNTDGNKMVVDDQPQKVSIQVQPNSQQQPADANNLSVVNENDQKDKTNTNEIKC